MEQSVPNVSSPTTDPREIFAQAPFELWAKLAHELVYVQNPSLVLINHAFERRRLFQDLLYRYFRQILYGCKNPSCNFPTCLSYQKRVSKGPFRSFTNLSAWTLATFLATQDNAEEGLCSNEPVIVQHGPRRHLESKHVDQTPVSIVAGLENQHQDGSIGGNIKSPRKKDLKSFTQNLCDTVPMKLLQLTKVPEEFSECRSGRYTAEGAISVEDIDDAIRSDQRQSDDESRFGDFSQSELLSCQTNSEAAESQSLKVALRRSEVDARSFMPGLWHFSKDRLKTIFNMPGSALIDSGSQSTTGFGHNYREIDTGLTQYVYTHGSRSKFMETLPSFPKDSRDYLVDGKAPTMLVAADSRLIRPPLSLSRFTTENLEALRANLEIFNPNVPDEQKYLCSFGRTVSNFRLDSLVNGTATRREREIAFVAQSIIFVLSSSDSLLKSFRDPISESENPEYKYEFLGIIHAFVPLFDIDFLERCMFSSLRNSANKLYPPKYYYSENSNLNRSLGSEEALESKNVSGKSSTREMTLNDNEAIHIAKIALAALIARVSKENVHGNAWATFCQAHARGRATYQDPQLKFMDIFDDELCIELMTVLVKAMVVRKYMSEIRKRREPQSTTCADEDSPEHIINKLLHDIFYLGSSAGTMETHVVERRQISRVHAEILLQWLRSVILKRWDGKASIQKWGAVGCALVFMSCLFQISGPLGISPSSFETPFFFTRLDIMQLPTEWLFSTKDRNIVHLLSFRFLFSREILVSYFRAINHTAMVKAYNGSVIAERLSDILIYADRSSYDSRLAVATKKFLVLDLERENILTDAMNQLWRRERYELMRPLKVRIGKEEGEEGVDQGGLQQEFMRIVTREWIRPEYDLFTTDDQSRMTWFRPLSHEPLYKFELLGLIASLAVYNGLTIPVTFPLALYRKLLKLPVTRLEHIRDGWPGLSQGLRGLLDWEVGSVEKVFARSYGFSVEAFGETININLGQIKSDGDWPSTQQSRCVTNDTDIQVDAAGSFPSSKSGSRKSSASSQLPAGIDQPAHGSSCSPADECLRSRGNSVTSQQSCMVNNENRGSYVDDYIFWVTDKSIRSQYEAFARGFHMCIDPEAISIFSPEDLKIVVEGIQHIDVDELCHTTTYENGYSLSHRVIQDFWHVVRDFSPAQLRQLLEFVTASDRVPAKGLSSVQFVILKNGDADERLPTSLTCFGKLLLPEYSSRSVLKERLCAAIEHCKGFGLS